MKLRGGSFKGSFKGTLGNYTVYTRKGEQILRMKQENVFNPKSELQIQQRNTFAHATSIAKTMRDNLKEMYGAIDKNTDYSALMKMLLNSLSIQVPYLARTQSRIPMIKQGKTNINLNVVGTNYTDKDINIFELGRSMAVYKKDTATAISGTELFNVELLINGSWIKELSDTQKEATFYFGSDVLLPNSLLIKCYPHNVSNNVFSTVTTYSSEVFITPYEGISVEQFDNGKNFGFVSELSLIGGGWNFIYTIKGSELVKIIDNMLFNITPMVFMDKSIYNNTNVVSMTYLVAVPFTASSPAAQILKGITYTRMESELSL